MFTIEKMTKDHWSEVSKIYQEGIDSNIATFEWELPDFKSWDEGHLPGGRFVALEAGRVIGFIVLSATSQRKVYEGVAELSVYVLGEKRGQGVATALIGKEIEYADRNNLWMLQATILEENEGSIYLHEKCGFRKVGYRLNIGRDRYGNWRNTVLMERRSKVIGFEGCDMNRCPMRTQMWPNQE